MALSKAGVQLIAENLGGFVADMNKADKSVQDFGSNGAKSFSGVKEIMTGALRQVGAGVIGFAAEGAKAIGSFVQDSVKQAGDFEQGMLNFSAVANLDTKGLDQFKSLFISLGKELPVSTAEVQQAATELVKGGIDPATIAAGGLKTSLQFAAAGNLELAQAAEIGAKVVGGWTSTTASAADKATFMASSMDLMSKAANASTVDVDELALGLYNVQGTAKAAGVSFDDTVTTLAAVSSSFNSSSEAGTSMKNFLVRLQPTTKPATAAMAELGLYTKETGSAFYDANGKFVGMEQASALLQNALAGTTDAQKVQALQTIFGNDAMGVASKLTELGAAGYANMAQQIAAQASVQETAALKQQGFNTALDNFHGSIEALQITVGGAVIPVLTWLLNNVLAPGVNTVTSFADAIGGNADAFASLPGPLQSIVTVIQAVVTAAQKAAAALEQGGLSGAISAFGDSIKDINPTIGGLIAQIAPLADQLQSGLGQAMRFASEHSDEFKGALIAIGAVLAGAAIAAGIAAIVGTVASLAGPIGLVVGAVALLGAAWAGNWGDIQGKTAAVWAVVQPVFAQLVTWLQTNIPAAVQVVSDFWTNTLQPALNQVVAFIQANVMPILNTLTTVALAQLKAEVQAGAALWTGTLQPALNAVWSFISGSVIPIIKALWEVELAALKLAISTVSGVVTGVIIPALKDLWKWFTDLIAPITNSKEALGGAKTAGDIAKGAMDALGGAVGWLIGKLGDFVAALKEARDWLNSLKPPDWLVGHSPPPMANWFADIAQASGESAIALSDFGQQMDTAGAVGASSIQSIIDGLTAMMPDLQDAISLVSKKSKDAFKQMLDDINKLIEESFQAAIQAIDDLSSTISSAMSLWDQSATMDQTVKLTNDIGKAQQDYADTQAEIAATAQAQADANAQLLADQGELAALTAEQTANQQALTDAEAEYEAAVNQVTDQQQALNAAKDEEAAIKRQQQELEQQYKEGKIDKTVYDQQSVALSRELLTAQDATAAAQDSLNAAVAYQKETQDALNTAQDAYNETTKEVADTQKHINDDLKAQTDLYQQSVDLAKQLADEQLAVTQAQNDLNDAINLNNQLYAIQQAELGKLAQAQADAAKIADPKEAEQFLSLQTDYIQQSADLQAEIAKAQADQDDQQVALLQQQQSLLDQQHDLQLQQFQYEQATTQSTSEQVAQDVLISFDHDTAQIFDDLNSTLMLLSDTLYQMLNSSGYASGTTSAPGGLAWVGEHGPELMYVPKGSQIYDHRESMALRGAMVQPVASSSQILNSNSGNTTYGGPTYYQYAPSYNAAPVAPQQDFYLMKAGLLPV